MSFATTDMNTTLNQSTDTLRRISDALFSGSSFFVLIISLIVGWSVGRIVAWLLRRLSRTVGRTADASTNLATVNRLRRVETWIILSIAIIRVLFLIVALYFWWVFTHDGQSSTGLVGASALIVIVLGGVFGPLLRDFAFGGGMMAEHWFGVGDLVTIEPNNIQGVVERITLRSTRIRGLNGEVIWISNQNIAVVRIAQKGVWTLAIEMFVSSKAAGETLIERVNALLPTGPSLVVRPLAIMKADQANEGVWHMTAVAEVAPGRSWLIERTAIELMSKLDEKSRKPVLLAQPVARYADNDTEREFARAVKNAKKTRRPARKLALSKNKD
jgi:hypothetical protein